jgi:hypothetical protein
MDEFDSKVLYLLLDRYEILPSSDQPPSLAPKLPARNHHPTDSTSIIKGKTVTSSTTDDEC